MQRTTAEQAADELNDREYAIVTTTVQTSQKEYTMKLKKMNALWQCRCGISEPFLSPVGRHIMGPIIQVIPRSLVSDEAYTKYTRLEGVSCWWCAHPFDGMPVGCPIQYHKVRQRLAEPVVHRNTRKRDGVKVVHRQTHRSVNGYMLHGYFCSWNCARAYGERQFPSKRHFIGAWIYSIVIAICRKLKANGVLDPDYIVPQIQSAPHFCILKKFGGTQTIDKYRRFGELDNGRLLTVVPQWLNIIPAGMTAADIPTAQSDFRRRYNTAMTEARLQTRPFKRRPPTDSAAGGPSSYRPHSKYFSSFARSIGTIRKIYRPPMRQARANSFDAIPRRRRRRVNPILKAMEGD